MKYIICGLGNIGAEYIDTRHNIGFMAVEALAKAHGATFATGRYGDVCEMRIKNQQLVLLKPSTYMNLSGNALRYWMQEEKVEANHVLVICDDINLPFGQLRLRGSGSAGGHNGLKDVERVIGSGKYARLRFGVGGDFPRGAQIDWVLGKFPDEEMVLLPDRLEVTTHLIESFCLAGLERTMSQFNGK